jgi:hypothetical protein
MKFVRFQLERWIQRGVFHQLLFVAGLIGAISVIGGLVAWVATDQFRTPLDGIWWSFLRLTDPGYLGDDEGAVLRIVSTVVTVLGYVLFMGSLIAIMTQWLNQTLRRFEAGLSPIAMRGHVVILGWTNRTPEIVRQLLGARGRLRRFLEEHHTRSLRIVIVADEVNTELRQGLRTWLGDAWRNRQIFLRAGSSLKRIDLERFDLPRAVAIIVPGDEFVSGDAETSDIHVVKTLLNLRQILEPMPEEAPPSIVAEVLNPLTVRVAQTTLKEGLEVISGDGIIARLLAQTIRDPRLAVVFLELLSHRHGCSLYVRAFPDLAGHHPTELNGRFERAVVIGAVRPKDGRFVACLNPPRDFRLERDDLLALIAPRYEDCVATGASGEWSSPDLAPRTDTPMAPRRVLVLGWSRKIGAIVRELAAPATADVELTLVSRLPKTKRQSILAGFDWDRERVRVEHVERDYAVSGVLEDIGLRDFNTIVLVASTLMKTSEEADARAIMAYELLRSVLDEQIQARDTRPEIVTEFASRSSAELFPESRDVFLVSPRIMGYLHAHVALRPALESVFGELFMTGGAEVAMRRTGDYELPSTLSFRDVERQAASHGEIALGVLTASGTSDEKLELCPPAHRPCSSAGDEIIIVLAARDEALSRHSDG